MNMRNLRKFGLCIIFSLIAAMAVPSLLPGAESVSQVQAAVKLNKKSITILAGSSQRLKVTGTSKKVTWKSANTKIATVSSKGLVKGIKSGRTTISAKVGKKTYKCKVQVKTNQFVQKAPRIKDMESGYIHFYPMKVYYKNGKLYYKARIYNRKPFRISSVSNVRLAVTIPDGSDEGILIGEKLEPHIDLAKLNGNRAGVPVKLNPGRFVEYDFVFSGNEILTNKVNLTTIKKIYYVAEYEFAY